MHEPLKIDIDALAWYERWEAMLNAYNLTREERFTMATELLRLPRDRSVRILDLGCGPGSLGFRILDAYPNASVVAMDFDPLLLAIGRGVAKERRADIEFIQCDFRRAEIWGDLRESFDAVVTTVALHWLRWENLALTYQYALSALKPGGWLLNSDHIAANAPEIQKLHQRYAESERGRFSDETLSWQAFWEALQAELPELDLSALRNAESFWEGSDDGLPMQYHLNALHLAGFEPVEVFWRRWGEAIIGGRRPADALSGGVKIPSRR